ncbi:carbamoyl-phosphate synthase small subunit [Carboxydocella thermautotrophica]|nr:carbamoyl-phosphate synthase small subunit [Carboxydocella thermautotrophica]
MDGFLILENGAVFQGKAFGAPGEKTGEVVFNTSMTGYQEILTDASYCGEIVVMTYPLQGNYGINAEDFEHKQSFVRGFVVHDLCDEPSNWRSQSSLHRFLAERGIVALQGIDTRALTRMLRQKGTMRGLITTSKAPLEEWLQTVRQAPTLSMEEPVPTVTCAAPYQVEGGAGPHIVVIDCGAKGNIIRSLREVGDCRITVVPARTGAETILAYQPDGVLISNGPGDPERVPYVIKTVQELLGKVPLFGICLGHQILALACGARTYKLKFGHRGANHPVQDLETGRVYITSQNHGYAVAEDSLAGLPLRVTMKNLNDDTVEGIRHLQYPAFSVQYHPEASPGPRDNLYLFEQFLTLVGRG